MMTLLFVQKGHNVAKKQERLTQLAIINLKDVVLLLNALKRKKGNRLNYLQLYNSLCKITIILICLVICAGGFVRMTGSGMGCPDWPKCFGYWIPPTNISDLPLNYKEIYSDRGYDKLDFNVFNTWTEYLNRILGLLSGIFCFVLLCVSFFINNRWLILSTFCLVILMGFQGWMGAVVVYSVLAPLKITIHMLIALLIVSVLLYLYRITAIERISKNNLKNIWIWLALLVSTIQIIFGTQVRESVDILLKNYDKTDIIHQLAAPFTIHKSIAVLVFLSNTLLFLYYRNWINVYYERQLIVLTILLLFLTGMLMTYYSLMGFFQLLHLLFAVSLFIIQVSILLKQLSLPTVKSP